MLLVLGRSRYPCQPVSPELLALIRAWTGQGSQIHIEIESECPAIRALAASLPPLCKEDIKGTILESPVYQLANELISHVSCAVPSAILRTVETAAGVARPGDTHIHTLR